MPLCGSHMCVAPLRSRKRAEWRRTCRSIGNSNLIATLKAAALTNLIPAKKISWKSSTNHWTLVLDP
jgi:hypothetical protein